MEQDQNMKIQVQLKYVFIDEELRNILASNTKKELQEALDEYLDMTRPSDSRIYYNNRIIKLRILLINKLFDLYSLNGNRINLNNIGGIRYYINYYYEEYLITKNSIEKSYKAKKREIENK